MKENNSDAVEREIQRVQWRSVELSGCNIDR